MAEHESEYTCAKNGEVISASTELGMFTRPWLEELLDSVREEAGGEGHNWVSATPLQLTGRHRDNMNAVVAAVQRRDELPERVAELSWGMTHALEGAASPEVLETLGQFRSWGALDYLHGMTSTHLNLYTWSWGPPDLITRMASPNEFATWLREAFLPRDEHTDVPLGNGHADLDTGSRPNSPTHIALLPSLQSTRVRGIRELYSDRYKNVLPRLTIFAYLHRGDALEADDIASKAFERGALSVVDVPYEARAFQAVRHLVRELGQGSGGQLCVTRVSTGLDEGHVRLLRTFDDEAIEVFMLRAHSRCALTPAIAALVLGIPRTKLDAHERALVAAGCLQGKQVGDGDR